MEKNWVKILVSTFRETKQVFSRNPWNYVICMISCFISLLCIGVVSVFGFFVYEGAQAVGKRFLNITVFLEKTASQNDINQTIVSFESLEGVRVVTYISPDEALEILKKEYPDMETSQNPLPSSLKIEPESPHYVSEIVTFARNLPHIEYIEDTSQHADSYSNIVHIMMLLGIALLLIFLLAFIFSVTSSIGISVFSFRKEITIMQLIGASPGYVRAPFLLIACASGFLSGILNTLVMSPIVAYVYQFYQSFLFFSPIRMNVSYLSSIIGVGLIVLGLFISLFSAIGSVNRYMK